VRRYLLPSEAPLQGRLKIKVRDFHYLSNVLRYRRGDRFPGVDKEGREYSLLLEEIGDRSLVLQLIPIVQDEAAQTARGAPELYLFQALLKGKKMDRVVRQATETGVQHIVPLVSEHSVVKLEAPHKEEKRLQRWQTLIREAVQQSGGTPPTLHPPMELNDVLEFWNGLPTAGVSAATADGAKENEAKKKFSGALFSPITPCTGLSPRVSFQ